MTSFVNGFLFDNEKHSVLLVRKQKPEWQRNKVNGIGGKIKEGESSHVAMSREFEEEVGLSIPGSMWEETVCLHYRLGIIHFFRSFLERQTLERFKNIENDNRELIEMVDIEDGQLFNVENYMYNLTWLIPLSLDEDLRFPVFVKDDS